MLVSILIPTRNRVGYLRESLASAQAQRRVDVEILVSDDGSTDGTHEFVREIAARDSRVRLLTGNPTPGIFENTTYLIQQMSGDVFTVLADDDMLDPEFCGLLAAPMAAEPEVRLTFCDHRIIDAEGRLLTGASRMSSIRYGRHGLPSGVVSDPLMLALRGGIGLGFALYRHSEFADEPYDIACQTAADWDYAIRAAERGGIYYVAGRHASYRDHGETASRRSLPEGAALALRVLGKHRFEDVRAEDLRRRLLRDAAKRHAYHAAAVDPAGARRSLELYRSLGGRMSLHLLYAELMLRLPDVPAAAVHDTISSANRIVQRLKRTLGR